MEFILTRTSEILDVPEVLRKLTALSSCTSTEFPDRKEDLCGETQGENNLKMERGSMNSGRVDFFF